MTREERRKLAHTPPAWMYEFDLGDGILTPLLSPELRQVHQTRQDMILSALEQSFPEGLARLDCLDVACNEGYFSFLLYAKGARVKGIDVRPLNIERARAVQRIQGQDPGRLAFAVEDFLANQDPPDRYDLTLFLGLLYHLENPMGALRILQRITRRMCVVETQLTRQQAPVVSGWGETGEVPGAAGGPGRLPGARRRGEPPGRPPGAELYPQRPPPCARCFRRPVFPRWSRSPRPRTPTRNTSPEIEPSSWRSSDAGAAEESPASVLPYNM